MFKGKYTLLPPQSKQACYAATEAFGRSMQALLIRKENVKRKEKKHLLSSFTVKWWHFTENETRR